MNPAQRANSLWWEHVSLPSLKAQLPPESRNARPCPGPGHGPMAAKKTRRYLDYQNLGGPCSHSGTQACTSRTQPATRLHTPLRLLVHAAPFPAHTLIPTHPVAPAFAVASSDTAPRCQGRVGGPSLCVPPIYLPVSASRHELCKDRDLVCLVGLWS